jgi:hypothetical protein
MTKTNPWQPALFAALTLAITALTFANPGTSDVTDFLSWSATLLQKNPFAGYALIADYPPLGPFILWAAAAAGHLAHITPLENLKLAIALFQYAAAAIAWRIFSPAAAIILFLLIAPYGSLLGYIDVFYLPFILLGLLALTQNRPAFALLLFTAATLIKWQPAILCPIIFIQAFATTTGAKKFLFPLPAAAFAAAIILAFSPASVWWAFSGATTDPYFSGQAFNLDWLATGLMKLFHIAGQHFSPDGTIIPITALPPPWYGASKTLFWIAYLTNLAIFATRPKTPKRLILALLTAQSIQFTLNTGVHENHAFLILALGFIAVCQNDLSKPRFTLIAALALSNILLFYAFPSANLTGGYFGAALTMSLATIQCAMCIATIHSHIAA